MKFLIYLNIYNHHLKFEINSQHKVHNFMPLKR
jgi:hypothetical protein